LTRMPTRTTSIQAIKAATHQSQVGIDPDPGLTNPRSQLR
jgi:hypothetical protein